MTHEWENNVCVKCGAKVVGSTVHHPVSGYAIGHNAKNIVPCGEPMKPVRFEPKPLSSVDMLTSMFECHFSSTGWSSQALAFMVVFPMFIVAALLAMIL